MPEYSQRACARIFATKRKRQSSNQAGKWIPPTVTRSCDIGYRILSNGWPRRTLAMNLPSTLGELRKSTFTEKKLRTRRVKDELRENLLTRLRDGHEIFPGLIGYDDTVVPQIV